MAESPWRISSYIKKSFFIDAHMFDIFIGFVNVVSVFVKDHHFIIRATALIKNEAEISVIVDNFFNLSAGIDGFFLSIPEYHEII